MLCYQFLFLVHVVISYVFSPRILDVLYYILHHFIFWFNFTCCRFVLFVCTVVSIFLFYWMCLLAFEVVAKMNGLLLPFFLLFCYACDFSSLLFFIFACFFHPIILLSVFVNASFIYARMKTFCTCFYVFFLPFVIPFVIGVAID